MIIKIAVRNQQAAELILDKIGTGAEEPLDLIHLLCAVHYVLAVARQDDSDASLGMAADMLSAANSLAKCITVYSDGGKKVGELGARLLECYRGSPAQKLDEIIAKARNG